MKLNSCSSLNHDIPALTGMRFFAAFFVFLAHALPGIMPINGDKPALYTLFSSLYVEGMTLFFVLSGFVIHYNYAVSIRTNRREGIFNFFVARFARLYPLFFVALCFDLLTNLGFYSKFFWEAIPYYLTLTQSWFYVPLGQSALIYQFGSVPAVAWSVSTEWFFYLAYPVLCFGLSKIKLLRSKMCLFFFLNIVVFSIIYMICLKESAINHWAATMFGPIGDEANGFQDSFYRWLVYFSPYSRISEFFIGCLTAAIYMQLKNKIPSALESRLAVLLIVFSIISISTLHYFSFAQNDWIQSLSFKKYAEKLTLCFGVAPFIALIIFFTVRYQNAFSRFFTKRALLIGGEASYSLYLFHAVIISAFAHDATIISSSSSLSVYLTDVTRLCIAFVATLGLAIVFYNGIETPARRYLRKKLMMQMTNTLPSSSWVGVQRNIPGD